MAAKEPVRYDLVTDTVTGGQAKLWGQKILQSLIGLVVLTVGLIVCSKFKVDKELYEIYSKNVMLIVIALDTANVGITVASILKK